jgi:ABC-type uncharacterized transport system substrate-binding protein
MLPSPSLPPRSVKSLFSHARSAHRATRCLPRSAVLAALISALVGWGSAAIAHPHVTVTASTTVQVDNGTITGFTHVWTFDELYSAMAVDGLDKNGDGKYTREDLAELAKVNIDGLKEFGYFTQVALAGKPLALSDPTEFWLEHKDGVLALHFKLPLAKPVLLDARNFTFAMTDPSFFIAFDLARPNPVTLSAGAPATCKGQVAADADTKSLTDAFSQQLGTMSLGTVHTLTVVCGTK